MVEDAAHAVCAAYRGVKIDCDDTVAVWSGIDPANTKATDHHPSTVACVSYASAGFLCSETRNTYVGRRLTSRPGQWDRKGAGGCLPARGRTARLKQVNLTTDRLGNDAANRFYQQLGFTRSRTYVTPEGREMQEYLIDL